MNYINLVVTINLYIDYSNIFSHKLFIFFSLENSILLSLSLRLIFKIVLCVIGYWRAIFINYLVVTGHPPVTKKPVERLDTRAQQLYPICQSQ